MKCTMLILGAVLLFPAGLLAQGQPETRKPPGQATKEAEVPPFCKGEHPRNFGEIAHPKHGADWCRQETQGLHGDDGALPVLMAKMEDGLPLEPWCRDGAGHPEFGMEWCTLSQDAWARRQERARNERVGGVRFVP